MYQGDGSLFRKCIRGTVLCFANGSLSRETLMNTGVTENRPL